MGDERLRAEAPAGSVSAGVKDIRAGLARWPVWWTLTWHAIRSQYRRTYLGPWWMTLQMVIFVAGLSLLFGILLGQDLSTFVPYVGLGFVCFNWMTGMIQGGATSIVQNGSAIKTTPGPASIYSLRVFAGQTIQFGHDALVMIVVLIVFQVHVGPSIILLPVSLIVISVNGIATSLWLGPLAARYRDVGQIVSSVVRVLFFFTPIFWVPGELSRGQTAWLAAWNPLAYLLELFRTPLLGSWPTVAVLVGSAVVTIVNCSIGLVHFSHTRDRLAYWL